MVHPQCRGYIHRTMFIFNNLQTHSYDLHTQLQIFSTTQNCALSCRTYLQKPSAHSAAKVVDALSWDLTLNPKIDLSFFASNYHHKKTYLTPLHKCLFIQVHYYNTMGTQKPWDIYKKRGFDPTLKPLRLFWTITPLTSFAPKPRSCQN